jgi:hypothetical protein
MNLGALDRDGELPWALSPTVANERLTPMRVRGPWAPIVVDEGTCEAPRLVWLVRVSPMGRMKVEASAPFEELSPGGCRLSEEI